MTFGYSYGGRLWNSGSKRAAEASGEVARARTQVDILERRLERALLGCEAMWSILRDKLGVTDEELYERMNDLDLSDGQLDGKVRREPGRCGKCGRTVSPNIPKCMYCGALSQTSPFT